MNEYDSSECFRPVTYTRALPGIVIWVQEVARHHWLEKLTVGFAVATVSQVRANVEPLLMVLLFWGLDFGMGVARAIADPEIEVEPKKAAVGVIKPFVIVMIWLAAMGFEWMIWLASGGVASGYYMGGKLVLVACIGMAWEEASSFGRNGAHFYRHLRRVLKRAGSILGKRVQTDPEED